MASDVLAVRVRAANALLRDARFDLRDGEDLEKDFVACLNVIVATLMRAGLGRVLVLTDVRDYARGALADSLRRGLFVREDEVWDHGDDAILVEGMGIARSVPLIAAPRLTLADYDGIVCALADPRARLMLRGDEFNKPGRYALKIAKAEDGSPIALLHGEALREPIEEEMRAEERGADHAREAQERSPQEAI